MKKNQEYIIWQDSCYYNEEDIEQTYEDYLELGEPEYVQSMTKEELFEEHNLMCLDDEKENLNISVPNGIIGIACLGLWNGERLAYSKEEWHKIYMCLGRFINGYYRFFVKDGDLCATCAHHDGTNSYTFREWKKGVTENQKEKLKDAIFHQEFEEAERLTKLYTKGLGRRVADVYGW